MQEQFNNACNEGNLEIAKRIYFVDSTIDIHADNEYAFTWVCGNGHLEMAKWLYSLDGKIDIHASNNGAFVLACSAGYLEIAKWLYSLNKIDIMNNLSFLFACGRGHLEVAKWLYQLLDNIDEVIEDKIINQAKYLPDNLFQITRPKIKEWINSVKNKDTQHIVSIKSNFDIKTYVPNVPSFSFKIITPDGYLFFV